MPWVDDLHASQHHWLFDFVLENKYCHTTFGVHFNLTEVALYPILPHLEIFKVFKDKSNRLHYFTFSNFDQIQLFLRSANSYQFKRNCLLTNSNQPRLKARVLKYGTTKPDFYIYCAPHKYIPTRSVS